MTVEELLKILDLYDQAVKQTVSNEVYLKINSLYLTKIHNDFCINTEMGRQLVESGAFKLKPEFTTIIDGGDLDA